MLRPRARLRPARQLSASPPQVSQRCPLLPAAALPPLRRQPAASPHDSHSDSGAWSTPIPSTRGHTTSATGLRKRWQARQATGCSCGLLLRRLPGPKAADLPPRPQGGLDPLV